MSATTRTARSALTPPKKRSTRGSFARPMPGRWRLSSVRWLRPPQHKSSMKMELRHEVSKIQGRRCKLFERWWRSFTLWPLEMNTTTWRILETMLRHVCLRGKDIKLLSQAETGSQSVMGPYPAYRWDWKARLAFCWKQSQHINVLEVTAFLVENFCGGIGVLGFRLWVIGHSTSNLVQWVIPFYSFMFWLSVLKLVETICQLLFSQFQSFSLLFSM